MNEQVRPVYETDKEYIASKRRFINLGVLLGSAAALTASFMQYRHGHYAVAMQSLCFPLLAPAVLLYQRRNEKAYRRGLMLFALLILCGQGFSGLSSFGEVFNLCWYVVYPLAYFFLLGPRRGLLWSFVGLCVSLLAYWLYPHLHGRASVSSLTFVSLMLAYCVAVMLSWFHARSLDAYQRNLYARVNFDHLTGAMSRVGGIEMLQRYVNLTNRHEERDLAVVAFDLDDFKSVNDELGHDTGDRVLRCTADAITAQIRRSDCLVRWGGEEFLLLLPDTSIENARASAEKLRTIIGEATHKLLPRRVTASVGVTEYRRNESVSGLLKRVDGLMYMAKRSGKDTVAYEPQLGGVGTVPATSELGD
jgi:diguanylate cyclase (GGDEF)-like protein